ncbi:host cell attachment protein [Leptospira santarosai str. CBC523]|nr:host cell attachment protein [Leptospira santarosai str. CBC523]
MGTAAFSFRILKQTLNQENLARYGSLIFALQRTNILFRPIGRNNEFMRSAAFGYLARYGSLDRKENMKNKWVVVANRSEAKIFEYKGTRKGLELLESMKNPKGRMKNRDLILNSSRRVKAQRVAFDTESVQEPKRKVAESFASQISDVIAQGRKSNRFLSLVLISEPRFLGMLLDKMDRKSQSMIFHKMGKDITATNNREILSHLREILV